MEIIALIVYILLLLTIGYVVKSRIKSTDDYILGGRKIPWFLITASLAANDIGSGASMGIIQTSAKGDGLSAAWYIWLMIPAYIIGLIVAPYMRKTAVKTVPDFFRMKYGKLAQKLSALFIIVPNIGVIAINFTASASILHILLGLNFIYALLISVMITTLYSYVGGIFADMYNDVIQLIIILVGFSLTAFYISMSDTVETISISHFVDGHFTISHFVELIILYSAVFIIGLSTTTRIYSAKSIPDVRKGILRTIPIYLIYAIIPAYIGLMLNGRIENYEVTTILNFLNQTLPNIVFVFLFIGIMAASLSTVDTLLIGCSAMLMNDMIPNVFMKMKNEKKRLAFLKLVVFSFAILAFIITVIGIDDIIQFLLFLLKLQTCALFIPFVLGHVKKIIVTSKQCNCMVLFSSLIFLIMSYYEIEIYFINPLFGGITGGIIIYVFMLFLKKDLSHKKTG